VTEGQRVQQETAAIVRLITDATAALTRRDFDAWANCWVHAPHVRRISGWTHGRDNWTQGGIIIQEGWDEIWPPVKLFLADPPYAVYPNGTLCKNWNVRVGREVAWATFDQYPLDDTGQPAPDFFGLLRETRVLEKQAGKWKIAYLSFFHELPLQSEPALVRVDEKAAIKTMSRAAAELIGNSQIFRVRDGRLHATDRETDLQLQAVIRETALAGPWTVGAVRVPLLLKAPSGSTDCVCWIASSLDMQANALIAIGDAGALRRRLQNAILVYHLSPAQARLAERIIEGRDLVVAAEDLGVTVNTARTQLHRMFEKTGVRSQPALVRVLLSVAEPTD
jgi:DNA-binding CsgD family transcriptional regulator